MIRFRRFSQKEYSSFDYYTFDHNLNRLADKLDRARIDSYGVLRRIPTDYISISYSPYKMRINIPSSISEYESTVMQDLYGTTLGVKMDVSYDYGFTRITVNNRMSDQDVVKFMRALTRDIEYVILVPGSSS